jgi:hypothetical protein
MARRSSASHLDFPRLKPAPKPSEKKKDETVLKLSVAPITGAKRQRSLARARHRYRRPCATRNGLKRLNSGAGRVAAFSIRARLRIHNGNRPICAEVSAHVLCGGGIDSVSRCRRHPIDADGYFSGDPHSGRNRDLTPAVVGSRAVVGLQCLLSTGRHHGHHGHGAFIDAGTIVTSPLNGPSPFSATTQPVTTELAGISVDPTLTVMPTPNTSACAEGTTMNLATPGTMTPPNPTGAPATTGVSPPSPAGC